VLHTTSINAQKDTMLKVITTMVSKAIWFQKQYGFKSNMVSKAIWFQKQYGFKSNIVNGY
jgi:hypothetical protein